MADLLDYYQDQTIAVLTSSAVHFSWPFKAQTIILSNDDASGSNILVYGFAGGSGIAGKLKPTERIILRDPQYSGIDLHYETGAPAYRVMVNGK